MQNSPLKYFGWKWPLFLIVIALELYYMFQYANTYGALSLIALILTSIVLGIILMRWEGSICWKRILYMERNNMPTTNEMRDGVLILFAGILMIIPGIITSAIGLLLFMPPIRWVVSWLFLRNLYFEIPEGMGSQFQMFSFSTSNAPQNNPSDASNNSEDVSQDDYSDSFNDAYHQNPDVQIIDVKATDPNESPPNSNNENMLENQNGSERDRE
ncbi:MAG: FxsA family protein [Thermoguttaceae bacterium]|nr:FxsA family protein [Thermoguttaceae bacterium]